MKSSDQILRIDKILSHLGLATRSEAKKLARAGEIKVNGVLVKDSGTKINVERDVLELGGEIVQYRTFIYLMMNKPAGVISATEDLRERTVLDLVSEEYRAFSPFPVGRLDKDTEGLLVLTNDGMLAHRLLSPRRNVPKTYYAEVEGRVDEHDMERFKAGVELDDGYVTMPARLTILECFRDDSGIYRSRVELVIFEGKYHQVKRMFAATGKKVTYLRRIAMGGLTIDPDLPPGSYRELTEQELQYLSEGQPDDDQISRA